MTSTLPPVLSIAGSDSSGGAGIQADLKTMLANGVFGMTAIAALTAQNTTGVTMVTNTPPEMLAAQIDAVFEDIPPVAVKIGMVSSAELITVIADRLTAHNAKNVVLDPVMVATSGAKLIEDDAIAALTSKLFPLATVITPNMPETQVLCDLAVDRMSLSVKNGWLDEQNRVFIICTIEDVKRALCCADNKATKLLRELEKFGLIERKRRGLGKPSLVYVKNFSAESSKSIFQNRDFHDSGGFKNASQDPSKSRCNKTKENDTEMSETDPFYSEEADGMSKRTQLEEYFSQSLEIDLLLRLCPDDEDTIYQIVDLLV